MSTRTKRLALIGKLPLANKYLIKSKRRISTEKQLERDGWVVNGEGFADSGMLLRIYRSYYRDNIVCINKTAAIPHYAVCSSDPDYWMYGDLIERHYIYLYEADDRIENRGLSYHRIPQTIIIDNEEFGWSNGNGYGFD